MNAQITDISAKGHAGASSSTSRADAHFSSHTTSHSVFEGGNYQYSLKDWSMWVNSIKDAPAQIRIHLKPISGLLHDTSKSANLDKAVLQYATESQKPGSSALPADIRMSWCDCITEPDGQPVCRTEGMFLHGFDRYYNKICGHNLDDYPPSSDARCCKPCFSNDYNDGPASVEAAATSILSSLPTAPPHVHAPGSMGNWTQTAVPNSTPEYFNLKHAAGTATGFPAISWCDCVTAASACAPGQFVTAYQRMWTLHGESDHIPGKPLTCCSPCYRK